MLEANNAQIGAESLEVLGGRGKSGLSTDPGVASPQWLVGWYQSRRTNNNNKMYVDHDMKRMEWVMGVELLMK